MAATVLATPESRAPTPAKRSALRARAQGIVARVAHVEAASRAARERQEAAERMRRRRVASAAMREHVRRRDSASAEHTPDAGNRPGLVWRAVDDDCT